uniref:Uncharacterized protein n=1 Tax=Cannabis sativa TaxID=3483 RepID=A0A803P7Z2_CANSA
MACYCSKEEEALLRLFYNASSSFKLFFIFSSLSFIFLTKIFHFIGTNPIFPRSQYSNHEYTFSDDDEEEEEEEENQEEEDDDNDNDDKYCYYEENNNDHLVADIICGGESLFFLPNDNNNCCRFDLDLVTNDNVIIDQNHHHHQNNLSSSSSEEYFITPQESLVEEIEEEEEEENQQNYVTELLSIHDTDTESDHNDTDDHQYQHQKDSKNNNKIEAWPISHHGDDDENKFISFGPISSTTSTTPQILLDNNNNKMLQMKGIINGGDDDDGDVYGDSCTVGSTSKSSSEWRSSINYRDSGTDDPFSSSSRRSCPKWESYTVFQKYDEEMIFFDKITAQKLHETESLRSIKVSPRSVSERIVHRISMINKTPKDIHRNPYHELEAAYVAQICLTWEALNWNYKKFQEKRRMKGINNERRNMNINSDDEYDIGCPGQIAQQFQQFQVLLQRYIENEPYENGRRPEIYARMRLLAPKLLQVPEYRDSLDDQRDDEGAGSRISSPTFLIIMEDCIHTFMNFLKADKENTCQIITSLFRRKRRKGSVDPTLLQLIKKVNQKKKMKLKDLRRARKCLRRRRLKVDEGMEIVMGLIDLKVVSRVLRMKVISEEQMHWCEEKMSKVKILDGKLQRDSSTLFFPSH